MFTSIDKAIVALLTSLLTILAAFGLETSTYQPLIAPVGAILTTFVVWLVPNKPA